MKAKLEFNLPEEKEEFDNACKALDYRLCLSDISDKFRYIEKYSDEETININDVREIIWSIMEEYGVEI